VEEIRRIFCEVAGIRQSLRDNRLKLNDLLFSEAPDEN